MTSVRASATPASKWFANPGLRLTRLHHQRLAYWRRPRARLAILYRRGIDLANVRQEARMAIPG
jgi:hypothetical protein